MTHFALQRRRQKPRFLPPATKPMSAKSAAGDFLPIKRVAAGNEANVRKKRRRRLFAH
jgi:hypothetical protein